MWTGFRTLLARVFSLFNITFTEKVFILGAGYEKEQKKWQVFNFISGTAKMVIYVSRKNKVEEHAGQDVASVSSMPTEAGASFLQIDEDL